MDPNGMQTIMTASPAQIRMLQDKLVPRQAYAFLLRLGRGFSTTETVAFIRPMDGYFQLRVPDTLRYTGADEQLRAFAQRSQNDEPTLEQLIDFIRENFGSLGRATAVPTRQAVRERSHQGDCRPGSPNTAAETDLQEAWQRLQNICPENRLLLDPLALKNRLRQLVHGQDACVDLVADQVSLELAKHGRSRPLSFFFIGPSGVGKTALALTLAEALDFPHHDIRYTLVRLNMNEYQERHSAYRFVGAPPGYVGYGDPPLLFKALAQNRHLVILFDEIEKAHPDILKTLMNLIDIGQLSHPATVTGEDDDFRRCVLIFTSNVGTGGGPRPESVADGLAALRFQQRAREWLVRERLPAEIVGRIRWVVVFTPLRPQDLLAIAAEKVQRCAEAYGVGVSRIAPDLLAQLASRAASSAFGVRILEQVVDQMVAPRMLDLLRVKSGTTEVEIGFCDGKVVLCPTDPR